MEAPKIPDLLVTNLPASPTVNTAYTFTTLHEAGATSSIPPIWLLFVNGLGLPQAFWQPTIANLKPTIPGNYPTTIYTTTYDRQYQGLSQPTTPTNPPTPAPLHTFESSIDELSALVTFLKSQHPPLTTATTILVSHSIGVPLARLYTTAHSTPTDHPISAVLMLDSNPASIDLPNVLPDPDSPNFSPSQLPEDTDIAQLTSSRQMYTRLFAATAPNAEGLDRSHLANLLPQPSGPVLPLSSPGIIRVLAHDLATFEEEGLKICTRGLTRMYIQPAWDEYNRGLLQLDGKGKGEIKFVEGAGHFVQRDRPDVVAAEVWSVVGEIIRGREV